MLKLVTATKYNVTKIRHIWSTQLGGVNPRSIKALETRYDRGDITDASAERWDKHCNIPDKILAMEVLRKLLVDRCPEEKRLGYKYAPDPETGNDPELTLIFQKRVPIDYEDVSTDMIAERVLLAKARGEAVPEINGYEHYDPRFLPKWACSRATPAPTTTCSLLARGDRRREPGLDSEEEQGARHPRLLAPQPNRGPRGATQAHRHAADGR